ncbi:hybrid sensor histidine kinase/response regulator transcription factor [Parabacteroides sp. AM08-6]|uniref:hybrid sensor histidine kinase/response regulator transcription factor n=1 Tax=Parabacteroides sp. AM08-6 TaxID=2292053 RepID=UPI000EFDEC48|nr:hybrid sensor histidine kinase/response regulator transcription factor [Parabacteroides sp. AM08-6]RHJ82335.1 hybrid sensor histidine kinase/response regulator [Parabacteroides sp. AM08-6]
MADKLISRKIIRLYARLLFCILLVLIVREANASFSLNKADIPDLSNNAILCMHQDPDGYMWFGTYDGLNMYNGKDTYVFRFEPGNKSSLSSNIIHRITDAEPGYLWVSTFLGLDKFSIKEKKVTESYLQYADGRLMAADKDGNTLVIGQKDFISCYSPQTKLMQDIHTPGINTKHVKTLFTDRNNKFRLFTDDGKLKTIEPDFSTMPATLNIQEKALHTPDILYACTEDYILYFVDKDKQLYEYNTIDDKKKFLSDLSDLIEQYGPISQITFYHSEIYIGFSGSYLLPISHPEKAINLNIGIFCLLKDKNQDILWIGTDGQGIEKYYEKHNIFESLLTKDLPIMLRKPIRAIYTDSLKNLWIGTKGDGIARIKEYDQYGEDPIPASQITHFSEEDGLSDDKVYCFLRSKFNPIIWIGTDGPELSYYSYKEDKIKTLTNETSTKIAMVHSICEINDTTLWVATAGDGLKEVNLSKKEEQLAVKYIETYVFERNRRVCKEFHSMCLADDSTLYLGSRGGYGLIRFNIYNKKCDYISMDNLESSPIGDILCVHPSQNSTYYFGASSGLTRMTFTPNGVDTKQFSRKDGLANDMIHGILEDEEGCVWLSTNKGLAKYNPHNNFFHNYDYADLKVVEFSDDAYWKCPETNRMFFGGINGLVWIDPQTSNKDFYRPDLRFFELNMGDETFDLLDYTENKSDYVKIPPSVSSFTISFVATDYINGENYEYSYLLQNYNTTWTDLQKENKVTFTKLPYGDYILKVNYKNDVFESDTKNYLLHIRVLPPWYLSSWAILVYVALALLAALCAFYSFRRKFIRKQQQVAKKIQEEQKEKLYEAKLNFFANITHELCTPLTLINGVSNNIREYAKTETDEKLIKNVDVLSENVNGLNELIQEILDFRKIEESGINKCHIRKVSISELMKRQANSFAPIAEHNQIRFECSVPGNLDWNTDPAFFKKIVVNLISNAFKYTEEKGLIQVSVFTDSDRTLTIKVYNTGQGIEASKLKGIFDRYRILDNMEENAYTQTTSRNGLGLFICHSMVQSLQGEIEVKSEFGKYAEFIVTLPYLETEETEVPQTTSATTKQEVTPATKTDDTDKISSFRPYILVIDDNKDIVWLIASSLSADYSVKEAYSAMEALKMMEQQTPALIITDIMMPDMNGLELVKTVKANKFTKQIPIVIVSAKITDSEQAEGLNLGADAYLTKPFSPLVLHSIVNRLMSSKQEMKNYYHSPESAYEYTDGQLIHQEDKEFMDMVNAIIKENIDNENLRPEFVAEKMGMNSRSFYRKFKKISSLAPSDFIKDYRFIYAAQLLITTNLNVQEIIYKVGITNKSYFYREFARKYNMTPKEYRSQQ